MGRGLHRRWLLAIAAAALSAARVAGAQERGEDHAPRSGAEARRAAAQPGSSARASDEEVAGRIANELASLVQIPILQNFEWGLGATDEGFRYLLVARPRIPIALGGEWLLVTTGVVRFTFIDDVIARDGSGAGSMVGMGDSEVYSLVAPPRLVEGLRFGVGPFALFPSGNPRLGLLNVGVGPAGAVTWQGHGVVLDLTVLHAWSFVDDESDYSLSQIIPAVSYVFDTGTAITVQSEMVYEWHSDAWTIPLNAGVSQVLSIGPFFRMSVGIQGKWWPESPPGGPAFGLRLITTLLFPELSSPAS